MKKGRTTDNKQMISDLSNRLDWFANEASPAEYNEAEVEAIRQLLDVLTRQEADEKDKTEKSLLGFWRTIVTRKTIRMQKYRLQFGEAGRTDYLCEERDEEMAKERENKILVRKQADRFRRRIGVHKGIVAAALVVTLFLGGTIGAYAQKSGAFYWFKKDKHGEEMLVAPESMDDSVNMAKYYHALEEVPVEYQEYTWNPKLISKEMKFVHYEVFNSTQWDRVLSLYMDDEEELRVEYISRIFGDEVEYHLQRSDSYDFLYDSELDGIVLEFYEKVSDDDTNYMVYFVNGCVQYIVMGNLTLEEMETLAMEYCEHINN